MENQKPIYEIPQSISKRLSEVENNFDDARKKLAIEKAVSANEMLELIGIKIDSEVTVNGWAHNGKTMVVERAVVEKMFGGGGYFLKIFGSVLKKDGQKGNQKAEYIVAFKMESPK